MFPNGDQDASKIDKRLPVQFQSRNRRSSDRRQTKNLCAIRSPGKMIAPFMPARMEQDREFARKWITKLSAVVFVIIATLAGQSQIRQRWVAPAAARANVFHRESLMRKVAWTLAVFAPAACAFSHGLADIRLSFTHEWQEL
jgi:hypothetical protein